MKVIILSFLFITTLTACTESERPAAQAKYALDSAQAAANQTAQHTQEMADQAKKLADK